MEDASGLPTVVLVIGIVSASERIEPVVDGEVPDFVVPRDGLAEAPLVVLDVVLEVRDAVVDVGQLVHVEGFDQEGPAEREAGVGPV